VSLFVLFLDIVIWGKMVALYSIVAFTQVSIRIVKTLLFFSFYELVKKMDMPILYVFDMCIKCVI